MNVDSPFGVVPSSTGSSVVDVDVDDSTGVHGAKSYPRFRVNLNPSRSMQLYPRHEGILTHIRTWTSPPIPESLAPSPTETGTGVGTDIWSIENTRHQWSSSLALLRILPLHGHYNPPEHHTSRPALPRFLASRGRSIVRQRVMARCHIKRPRELLWRDASLRSFSSKFYSVTDLPSS